MLILFKWNLNAVQRILQSYAPFPDLLPTSFWAGSISANVCGNTTSLPHSFLMSPHQMVLTTVNCKVVLLMRASMIPNQRSTDRRNLKMNNFVMCSLVRVLSPINCFLFIWSATMSGVKRTRMGNAAGINWTVAQIYDQDEDKSYQILRSGPRWGLPQYYNDTNTKKQQTILKVVKDNCKSCGKRQ